MEETLKIILYILILWAIVFFFIQIIECLSALGYVKEEKRRLLNKPRPKPFQQHLEEFWRNFWRKILLSKEEGKS